MILFHKIIESLLIRLSDILCTYVILYRIFLDQWMTPSRASRKDPEFWFPIQAYLHTNRCSWAIYYNQYQTKNTFHWYTLRVLDDQCKESWHGIAWYITMAPFHILPLSLLQVAVDIATPPEVFDKVREELTLWLKANAGEYSGNFLCVANFAGDPLKYTLCVWWEYSHSGMHAIFFSHIICRWKHTISYCVS